VFQKVLCFKRCASVFLKERWIIVAKVMNIVAIGDSITYGFPYTPHSSWVHLIGKQLDIPIINKGVNGDTTAGMLERFSRDVIHYVPSQVIIMGGTNDACADIDADEVNDNIRRMLELAVQYEIIPVIGLPIPCVYSKDEGILGLYREEMRQYGVVNNLLVIDFYTAFLEAESRRPKVELYADVLHPNKQGYKTMAKVALETLKASGCYEK
jgi:lysophospholipase L1-like esterase